MKKQESYTNESVDAEKANIEKARFISEIYATVAIIGIIIAVAFWFHKEKNSEDKTENVHTQTEESSISDDKNTAEVISEPTGVDLNLYQEVIESDSAIYEFLSYAYYDMDKDGIEEMIVQYGSSAADMTNVVYTIVENAVMSVGEFPYISALYEAVAQDGIYAVYAKDTHEIIQHIQKSGTELLVEEIADVKIQDQKFYSNDKPIVMTEVETEVSNYSDMEYYEDEYYEEEYYADEYSGNEYYESPYDSDESYEEYYESPYDSDESYEDEYYESPYDSDESYKEEYYESTYLDDDTY